MRIEALRLDELARPRFGVASPWGRTEVALAVSGAHMAVNAAAAIAVAGVLGVDPARAAAGLATAEVSAMRMGVVRTPAGGVVVDDAYNANPASMLAALDALAAIAAERRVAVLGMMAELDDPGPAHRAVAERAQQLGIDVVAVGTDLYGLPVVSPEDAPDTVGPIGPGTAVLVKASRAVGLERVVAALVG